MTIAGRPVDLRVSTLPTQFGESVVLRVLDKSVVNLDLKRSVSRRYLQTIRDLVDRPNGIFIVTTPPDLVRQPRFTVRSARLIV